MPPSPTADNHRSAASAAKHILPQHVSCFLSRTHEARRYRITTRTHGRLWKARHCASGVADVPPRCQGRVRPPGAAGSRQEACAKVLDAAVVMMELEREQGSGQPGRQSSERPISAASAISPSTAVPSPAKNPAAPARHVGNLESRRQRPIRPRKLPEHTSRRRAPTLSRWLRSRKRSRRPARAHELEV